MVHAHSHGRPDLYSHQVVDLDADGDANTLLGPNSNANDHRDKVLDQHANGHAHANAVRDPHADAN
jgi:hypothetical protein